MSRTDVILIVLLGIYFVADGFFRFYAHRIEYKTGGLKTWISLFMGFQIKRLILAIWHFFRPPQRIEPVIFPDGGDGGDVVICSGTGGKPGLPGGKPGKPGRLKLIIGAGGGDDQRSITALCVDPKDNTVTIMDRQMPIEEFTAKLSKLFEGISEVH